jgi:hypothetical protein
VCLHVYHPSINFWLPERIFMKFGIYITATEPISTIHFINLSLQSVCMHVYLLNVARQRLGKHIPAATNTRNNRRIVEGVVFYTVHDVSKDSLWVCLCVPVFLLGNGSVKTFLRQRRIVGRVVFCAVHVLSKESRQLVPPGTSCFLWGTNWICICHLEEF